MIVFKTLSLTNFLSFGNVPTLIALDRVGTTMIMGENLDDTTNGISSNGVGKTAIINALVYALYDKPLTSVSKKDFLINNINKKNMVVSLTFTKGDDEYTITRTRKSKQGNNVTLTKNGKDITPDSIDNTNKLVQQIIGISYDLFVRVVAFSANNTSFLNLPSRSSTQANQTDIIEELFRMADLSERATTLKTRIKKTEQELEIQKALYEQQKENIEKYKRQLKTLKQRSVNWDEENSLAIKQLEDQLTLIEQVDITTQKQLYEELQAIESELTETKTQFSILQKSLERNTKKHTSLKKELEQLQDDKCPYCHQPFVDANDKIEEITDKIRDLEQTINDKKTTIELLLGSIEELEGRRTQITEQIQIDNINELIEINGKKDSLTEQLEAAKNSNNPFEQMIREFEQEFPESDNIFSEKIDKITKLLNHQKFLLKLLTRKDSFIRKALLDRHLPFLNKRIAFYISKLQLPHVVEFTKDMTAKITKYGRELDFGNLSHGQQSRVNLALSFAFRDVVQFNHGRINIYMLDEVLDIGLDGIGIQHAIHMLKQKASEEKTSIFVISHKSEGIENTFDHKLIVKMIDMFSEVSFED